MVDPYTLPRVFSRSAPYLGVAELSPKIPMQTVANLADIGATHHYQGLFHICRLPLWF
jgi:hypothetical protein